MPNPSPRRHPATAGPAPDGPDAGSGRRYRPGYEVVAEQILSHIAEQALVPGDRLPTEKGLAEILGATRNVTREALKVLAAIGKVSVRKGAGIFVAGSPGALADGLARFRPTSMDQVLMLLDYRQLIESDTARRAASLATPVEARTLRENARISAEAAATDDLDAFARADELFHDSVSVAAHNIFLRSSVANIRRLIAQTSVLLFHGDLPGALTLAAAQHVAIAEAVSAGDAARAAALMGEHIDTTRQQFEHKIRDRLFSAPADRAPDVTAGGAGADVPPAGVTKE